MSYHNKATYDGRYGSDRQLTFYNKMADMGEDPERYNKEANQLIYPPKDPPIAIALPHLIVKLNNPIIEIIKNSTSAS